MNLKKSLMGAVAGLALVGSVAAPIASAQPAEDNTGNNTTTAYVEVYSTGVFDVFFTGGIDLGDANFNASSSSQTLNGSLALGYTDTKVQRPSFDVTVQATDFYNLSNFYITPIPASGFTITKTYNVAQQQWGANPDIGDIGAFQNEDYVAQNSGPWPWTSDNQLNTARRVNFGYAGIGTISSQGNFDVSLVVPNTTQAGAYQSTLTLTVIAGSQP
ncbi:MAG TPA: hypothetical protein VNP95_04330 [Thermomicrobiales bacterium]|nr:hypothetical protein [Thermomicrobiales bacterium]